MNISIILTLLRIFLTPFLLFFIVSDIPYNMWIAVVMFSALMFTDYLDGYFARKRKQVTKIGKLLDPIADKFLILGTLVFLIGRGVDAWMAVVIISREFLIVLLRFYLIEDGETLAVSWLGKIKTTVQAIALGAVMINFPFSWYIMLAATIITVWSGLDYFYSARKQLRTEIKDLGLNLPNTFSFLRIALAPIFLFAYFNDYIYIAITIFFIAGLTDFFDGYFARKFKQTSFFGSAIDPIADKVLILSAIIALFIRLNLPIWMLVVFLAKDLLILLGSAYILIVKDRKRVFNAAGISKITTVFQIAAILSLMIDFYSLYFLYSSIIFTILTGLWYSWNFFTKEIRA